MLFKTERASCFQQVNKDRCLIPLLPAGGLESELKIPQAIKDQYSGNKQKHRIQTIIIFFPDRFLSNMLRKLSVTFLKEIWVEKKVLFFLIQQTTKTTAEKQIPLFVLVVSVVHLFCVNAVQFSYRTMLYFAFEVWHFLSWHIDGIVIIGISYKTTNNGLNMQAFMLLLDDY